MQKKRVSNCKFKQIYLMLFPFGIKNTNYNINTSEH